MALNLRSISELPNIANSTNIILQMAALSSATTATDIADIEVSFKNATSELSSVKFSFGQFMNYVIGYLTMLSDNFNKYLPLTAYDISSATSFEHLSDDFLPNYYVYTKRYGKIPENQTQYIETTKKFNVSAGDKSTTFYTPVVILSTANIDTASIKSLTTQSGTIKELYSTSGNIVSLNTNNLTCTNSNYADLTAKCAKWN